MNINKKIFLQMSINKQEHSYKQEEFKNILSNDHR